MGKNIESGWGKSTGEKVWNIKENKIRVDENNYLQILNIIKELRMRLEGESEEGREVKIHTLVAQAAADRPLWQT